MKFFLILAVIFASLLATVQVEAWHPDPEPTPICRQFPEPEDCDDPVNKLIAEEKSKLSFSITRNLATWNDRNCIKDIEKKIKSLEKPLKEKRNEISKKCKNCYKKKIRNAQYVATIDIKPKMKNHLSEETNVKCTLHCQKIFQAGFEVERYFHRQKLILKNKSCKNDLREIWATVNDGESMVEMMENSFEDMNPNSNEEEDQECFSCKRCFDAISNDVEQYKATIKVQMTIPK